MKNDSPNTPLRVGKPRRLVADRVKGTLLTASGVVTLDAGGAEALARVGVVVLLRCFLRCGDLRVNALTTGEQRLLDEGDSLEAVRPLP
jgi:hypothetical protein